ncbi:MAG TPA: ATP-dependent DNA ligase [Nocardioidaceae bacterium]|nr:ATP-dependent DNA ligase [Nocardioidaceae bacterium]
MLLSDLVSTYDAVRATRARTAKIAALAAALAQAPPEEIETVAWYLSGTLPQRRTGERRTGLGRRSLTDLPEPATQPTLSVAEVDAGFTAIAACAGPGSQARRATLVTELFAEATAPEQVYLRGLVTGELRQGALEGVLVDAVAAAAHLPVTAVRRAVMLRGAIPPVAAAALTEGEVALERFTLQVGRPIGPMLASSAPDVDAALDKIGPAEVAVDTKLDGIRIQVHKVGEVVSVFTRSLDDVTERLPEMLEAVRRLPAETLVLDGEAIALDGEGRPRPFQETGARTASRLDVATLRAKVPVTPYFFDVLHHDGEDLLDLPAGQRFDRLEDVLPEPLVVPRIRTADPAEAQRFFDDRVAAGHEGVVVKSLDAPYAAGRRGAGWVKVKPRHTLDLVVLAVEWGSGRRRGWLSNIHLGARDPGSDTGWAMLGKTFKGMTDEMLAWQTERFLELETSRSGHVVHVRPEQVVEVAFDGIQTSSRYPSGMALRFARVVRYRDEKPVAEADNLETVRSLNG